MEAAILRPLERDKRGGGGETLRHPHPQPESDMNESWKLNAYWRPREESALAVAQRLEKFLELASAVCPNLGCWYKTGSRCRSGKRLNRWNHL